jgi:hypothetical protein
MKAVHDLLGADLLAQVPHSESSGPVAVLTSNNSITSAK